MAHWSVYYYSSSNEKKTVEYWLDNLTNKQLKSVAKELALLKRCGNQLKLPHSRALGYGLLELRERNFGLRVYYSFQPGNKIIVLHAGNKQSQTKDINIAYARLKRLTEEVYDETKKLSTVS